MTEIKVKGTKESTPDVPPYGCCCTCYPDGYVYGGIEGDLQGGCGCWCTSFPVSEAQFLNADWQIP